MLIHWIKLNSNKKYIAHEITKNLLTNPNVFYLTPLSKKNVFMQIYYRSLIKRKLHKTNLYYSRKFKS